MDTPKDVLPLWQSMKQVNGFIIEEIEYLEDGGAVLKNNKIGNGLQVTVDNKYVHKHLPQVGGFYVRYEDGYESWSPADSFIKGNIPTGDLSLHK